VSDPAVEVDARQELVADLIEILNYGVEDSPFPPVTEAEVGFIADELRRRGYDKTS